MMRGDCASTELYAKAFAIQYTSIILIVLTVILGALYQPGAVLVEERTSPRAPVVSKVVTPTIVHSFKIEEAFDEEGQVSSSAFFPVLELLRHHDLSATLSLYGPYSIEARLVRAGALTDYFERVLPNYPNLEFLLLPGDSGSTVQVTLYEDLRQ